MSWPVVGDGLRIIVLDSWHTSSAKGSGTAVGVRGLVTGLSTLGHEVHTIRPHGDAPTLPARLAFNLDLDRRLAEVPPADLVVGIDIDGFAWSGAPRHVPYVLCLKGIAADEARFEEEGEERWSLRTLARFERLNAARADRIVVPSRYSAEVAARMYGIAGDRIGVVPEAVDLSRWDENDSTLRADGNHGAALSPPPDTPTILSVARQYPRKDTATLLRAMATVLVTHPRARLRIVGDGPTVSRSRALVRTLGIDQAVAFLGAIPLDHDLAREYRSADVFCLPSRQEGFGIAFVEAMAAGLPVVAARAGAAPEVVPHDEVGLLAAPGDPEALARAIQTLLDDPDLRRRFGNEGRDRARRYDPMTVARAFLADVAPLLDGGSRAG